MRALIVVLALAAGVSPSLAKPVDLLAELIRPPVAAPAPMTPIPGKVIRLAQGCCKTCSKGKACGDSCISRAKQCHKGPGCACDG